MIRHRSKRRSISTWLLLSVVLLIPHIYLVSASYGDRLPEFQNCVEVCKVVNCNSGDASSIPIHLRLLLWTCSSECDYTCQRITTTQRLKTPPPNGSPPVVQYHGKWPFLRLLGMQEPFSVLFSLMNLAAHQHGLSQLRQKIPRSYALRPYYLSFAHIGTVAWICSSVFHTRDFRITEKADYFAAGANILYGFYYTPIRIFRLDQSQYGALLQFWTFICLGLYVCHVGYLTLWRWDYTYNMTANVTVGVVQNMLWSWFSIARYRRLKRNWAAWPGLIVAWIVVAMSMELLDFPPIGGLLDAHALWHLGTVGPTWWWYQFLIKDAEEDLRGERLKA
ncbi:MAG: hypothetical protein M1814_003425 [Vezdaea aestivalis]|nr:MAG: hypothetical protein M1814_003425 [Vezdaea aestivalis]